MSLIREKATESEAIVRAITKDIQVLDLAKDNLVLSMTTLKRLQMLGELPQSSHETRRDSVHINIDNSECSFSARGLRQGQEVSRYHTESICKSVIHARGTLLDHGPMQVVKEISTSFKQYMSVPRISQLWRRIQEIQGEIRTLIESDFDT
jgi:vacuolar protein sorting-associated protein 53